MPPKVFRISTPVGSYYIISKLPKEEVEKLAKDYKTFRKLINTSSDISYLKVQEYIV